MSIPLLQFRVRHKEKVAGQGKKRKQEYSLNFQCLLICLVVTISAALNPSHCLSQLAVAKFHLKNC